LGYGVTLTESVIGPEFELSQACIRFLTIVTCPQKLNYDLPKLFFECKAVKQSPQFLKYPNEGQQKCISKPMLFIKKTQCSNFQPKYTQKSSISTTVNYIMHPLREKREAPDSTTPLTC
jgi:hypothetical protein